MDSAFQECPGCVTAAKRVAALERELARVARENAQLQARLQQLDDRVEDLSRSAKRQAAPFSKGPAKADPKPPGRKLGPDYGTVAFCQVPPHIDETHEALLPEKCPRCGGKLVPTHVDQQYQVEIPRKPIHRQFNIAVGRCTCCDHQVRGRHPLQTSGAVGCCQSQVGPEAQAAVVLFNKELGLSQGKICRFFDTFFGLKLSRGGSCQIMQRAAASCEPHYSQIVTRVQHFPFITPDETGWRIGGQSAWLHVAVGDGATAYLIARQRGKEASDLLIGPDYAGKMTHDGWSPYDKYHAAEHQTCLGHLLARCKDLLAQATEARAQFPRKIRELLTYALETRDRRDAGKLSPTCCGKIAGGLEFCME